MFMSPTNRTWLKRYYAPVLVDLVIEWYQINRTDTTINIKHSRLENLATRINALSDSAMLDSSASTGTHANANANALDLRRLRPAPVPGIPCMENTAERVVGDLDDEIFELPYCSVIINPTTFR